MPSNAGVDKEDENSTLTFAFNKEALISDLDKGCFEAVVELKLRVVQEKIKKAFMFNFGVQHRYHPYPVTGTHISM